MELSISRGFRTGGWRLSKQGNFAKNYHWIFKGSSFSKRRKWDKLTERKNREDGRFLLLFSKIGPDLSTLKIQISASFLLALLIVVLTVTLLAIASRKMCGVFRNRRRAGAIALRLFNFSRWISVSRPRWCGWRSAALNSRCHHRCDSPPPPFHTPPPTHSKRLFCLGDLWSGLTD